MSDFLGVKNPEGRLIRRYRAAINGKPNKDRREVELALFKPGALEPYVGPVVNRGPLGSRMVKFYFKSSDDVDILRKYIKINEYVELNTYDVELLMVFLNLLEEGTLRYDETDARIVFVNDRGEEFPL